MDNWHKRLADPVDLMDGCRTSRMWRSQSPTPTGTKKRERRHRVQGSPNPSFLLKSPYPTSSLLYPLLQMSSPCYSRFPSISPPIFSLLNASNRLRTPSSTLAFNSGLYPHQNSTSNQTKNGARKTAWTRLSKSAGARFSYTPCPTNCAIQASPKTYPATVLAAALVVEEEVRCVTNAVMSRMRGVMRSPARGSIRM